MFFLKEEEKNGFFLGVGGIFILVAPSCGFWTMRNGAFLSDDDDDDYNNKDIDKEAPNKDNHDKNNHNKEDHKEEDDIKLVAIKDLTY